MYCFKACDYNRFRRQLLVQQRAATRYKDGIAIAGAKSSGTVPSNGSYTVQSKIDSCLSEFSDPSFFSTTRTIDLGNGQYIDLNPNPVTNRLKLNWVINGTTGLDVEIRNSQGGLVLLRTNLSAGSIIDMSSLLPGAYYVRIFDNTHHQNYVVRIVKIL